jgi:hypothetical protein
MYRSRLPALVLCLSVLSVAACSAGTTGAPTVTGTEPSHPPRTGPTGPSGSAPGRAAAGLPEVVSFEAPPEVACEGPSAAVRVTYETRDATAVGLVVDQAGSTAVEDPPLSGSQTLEVPCD